jgi:hypothetical protein
MKWGMGMMHTILNTKSISSIIKVVMIVFLSLMIGFEIVPSSSIKETQSIVIAGFQRAYSQSIEHSADILQYGSASQKAQALKDLQTTLSVFQQEQALLWTNPDPEVQRLLNQAQPDYLSIVVAAQVFLDHPANLVNPVQFTIILAYDRSFFSTMDTLVLLMEQNAEERSSQLLSLKLSTAGANVIILLFVTLFDNLWALARRKPRHFNGSG